MNASELRRTEAHQDIMIGDPELDVVIGRTLVKGVPSCYPPVSESIKKVPSTRYYGSKRRLLPWIYESVRELQFESALDIFGGSASVSLLLLLMRKSVTYHDGLRFNEDVARTLLSPTLAMARSDLVEFLKEVSGHEGVVAKQFSGVFYTDDENRWLDGYMSLVNERRESKEVTSLLRYLVYQACLKKRPFNLFHRANLRLRTKKRVKRSFGNFVTWERPFEGHILQAFDELVRRPQLSGPKAKVLQAGNVDDVPSGYDLVYIDPPYIGDNDGHNRDDYWRRYHFLEGLRYYADWQSMIDEQSEIRLLASPSWAVDWRKKSSFPDRLFSLIEKHRHSIVVLSYTSGARPTERALRKFFKNNFSAVTIRSRRHNHSLSNVSKRELLFIGHPKS